MGRRELMMDAVKRGKYAPLYHHLLEVRSDELSMTFAGLEQILGFSLPNSARVYRPWWANDTKSGHSQSMAWMLAGWRTGDVNLDAETLTFRKAKE